MNNKFDITIKISRVTYKKLHALKKQRGASIRWLVDTAVNEYSKK